MSPSDPKKFEVFCGGTTPPDAVSRSRPLSGTGARAERERENDFWRVATVLFINGGQPCIVRPVDTCADGASACRQL